MKWDTLATKKQLLDDEHVRTLATGEPPINPFQYLREVYHYTYAQLSKLSHIDEMALKRAEWGTYSNPLPSLVDFWVRRGLANHLELQDDYSAFVRATRLRYRFYFGDDLSVTVTSTAEHPFRQLRAKRPSKATNQPLPVGLVDTSKALCVSLDTIQFFEKKYSTQQSVPKPLKEALSQIGYSQGEIRAFEANYKEWRSLQVNRVVFA